MYPVSIPTCTCMEEKQTNKNQAWPCNMKMEFDCSSSKFAPMSFSIILLITYTIPVANLHPLDVDLLFHFAPTAFLCRHAGIIAIVTMKQ